MAKRRMFSLDVVITDWKVNNYIRADRYTATKYQKEKAILVESAEKYELPEG